MMGGHGAGSQKAQTRRLSSALVLGGRRAPPLLWVSLQDAGLMELKSPWT